MNIRTAAKTAVALTWLCFSVASHAAQVECSNQGPMLFSDWIQVRGALLSRPAILRMITNSNGSSINYLTRFQIDDSDVKIIEGSLAKRSDLSQVTEPFRVRSRIDKDFSSAIAVNRSVGFIYVKPAGGQWTFVEKIQSGNELYETPAERRVLTFFRFSPTNVVWASEMKRKAQSDFADRLSLPDGGALHPYVVINGATNVAFHLSTPNPDIVYELPLLPDGKFGPLVTNRVETKTPEALPLRDF